MPLPDDKPVDRRKFFRLGLAELLRPLASMARPLERIVDQIGRLDQAMILAGHARSVANEVNDPMLQAWTAMEAEPLYYRGLWDEAIRTAENALPAAWEIREWIVVFCSSAWLALACLKLGQPVEAEVAEEVARPRRQRAGPMRRRRRPSVNDVELCAHR